MKNKFIKNILIALALIFVNAGQTAVANVLTLDNFSDSQRVIDDGVTIGASSGTMHSLQGSDLSNVVRTFIAETTTNNLDSEIKIKSGAGLLRIGNGPGSAGQASIIWDFDPIDFTRLGTGLLLETVFIDLSVNAEIIVNGVASSGSKTFSEIGGFLLKFSDFSNNAVFSNVSSLRLNLSGPLAWDGDFRLSMDATPRPISTTVTSVPLPSAYFFMGSALLGFVGITRKKQSNQRANAFLNQQ